ncbi:Protein SFI1 [Orchesella cincta]|uniref:Protein SFI1 n=1 Tax=Orchesella cincta TaxID=48709 RepID=A0A1D2NKA1_ORCCI|nr:Protein SFI1 [Orchesella cincta]
MNNYGQLYAAGAAAKPQRRTSDTTDAAKRSKAQAIPGKQRRVRSEGPSLSTSPGSGITISGHPQASLHVPRGIGARPIPVMGRVRGSAPVLGATSLPLHRHNSMPHAPQSVPNKPGSPTRSESSSSSSSEPASPTVTGKFHLKLIARLRRSLRLKDPTPAAPSASPQPAATTA